MVDLSKVQYFAEVFPVEIEGEDLYEIIICDARSGEELSSGVEDSPAAAQAWIERECELLRAGDEETVNPDYLDRNPHLIASVN